MMRIITLTAACSSHVGPGTLQIKGGTLLYSSKTVRVGAVERERIARIVPLECHSFIWFSSILGNPGSPNDPHTVRGEMPSGVGLECLPPAAMVSPGNRPTLCFSGVAQSQTRRERGRVRACQGQQVDS